MLLFLSTNDTKMIFIHPYPKKIKIKAKLLVTNYALFCPWKHEKKLKSKLGYFSKIEVLPRNKPICPDCSKLIQLCQYFLYLIHIFAHYRSSISTYIHSIFQTRIVARHFHIHYYSFILHSVHFCSILSKKYEAFLSTK